MPTASTKASLGTVLLVLFLDLVGFSIVFPMYAEILRFYGDDPEGLLGGLMGRMGALFDIDSVHRQAAFFGGVLAGFYSVIQFLVTPLWGRLSDRIGRRPVLLWTVGLNGLGYLVWVFSGSFALFVASRIVCALASGNISVASAAVADLSDRAGRARAMGLMGAAIGLGFICGPALGITYGLMPKAEATGDPWSLNPFSFPAALAAGLCLINLYLVKAKLAETLPPEKRGRGGATRSANPLRFFRSDLGPGIARLNLTYLLFMVGFAGFEATLVFLLAERLSWEPAQIGGCMVWLGFCSAFVQGGLVRRLVNRTGERRLALVGLHVLIPGYALTATLGATDATPVWLWAGVTLIAVGVGFLSPTLAALVSLRTSAQTQGQAMGSYRSVGALGRAIGPLLAAWLYFRLGPGAPYVGAAILTFVPLALLFTLTSRPQAQSA